MSELRRSQQQYNSYVAALGAETVALSGLIRQLRNMLTQQASPLHGWLPAVHCMLDMVNKSSYLFHCAPTCVTLTPLCCAGGGREKDTRTAGGVQRRNAEAVCSGGRGGEYGQPHTR